MIATNNYIDCYYIIVECYHQISLLYRWRKYIIMDRGMVMQYKDAGVDVKLSDKQCLQWLISQGNLRC